MDSKILAGLSFDPGLLIIGMFVLIFFMLIYIYMLHRKQNQLEKKYRAFMRGGRGAKSLDEALENKLESLNNIKDINDSHGHEEGDTIIKKAASTLIVNQEPNTDIIRTDGNEFLVYMVGYSEKDVISYTRKIYKELKELPYGYGAAIGYSMIMDDIKTVDDAINEATIDMRNKKENNNG